MELSLLYIDVALSEHEGYRKEHLCAADLVIIGNSSFSNVTLHARNKKEGYETTTSKGDMHLPREFHTDFQDWRLEN
jgi:hypothetical protein